MNEKSIQPVSSDVTYDPLLSTIADVRDIWSHRDRDPKYAKRRFGAAVTAALLAVTSVVGVSKLSEAMPGVKDQAGFSITGDTTPKEFEDQMCAALADINNGDNTGCEDLAYDYASTAISSAQRSDRGASTTITVQSYKPSFGAADITRVYMYPPAN